MELLIIAVWFLAGLIGLSMACEGDNPIVIAIGQALCVVWASVSCAFAVHGALVLSGAI